MDPISITTGVLALVGNAIKLLDIVHEYSSEFQRAELNIRVISTECSSLQFALTEIDQLCEKNDEADIVSSSLSLVLGDCQEQLKMLLEKLQPFMQYLGSSPSDRMGIRARISATFKRQDIDSYRQGIQRQGQLVNLLLTTLQHRSILKIREILEGLEFQDLLQKSHQDTKSLRTAKEKANSSFYAGARSTKDSGVSVGPEVDSMIGDEEFPFDEELINTEAYRRAFKAAQKQRANPGQSQSPPSTDSSIPPTPSSTRTGFSKLFRNLKAMKIGNSGDPSSSFHKPTAAAISNTVDAGSNIVDPIDETTVEVTAGPFTDQAVRDARANFHELMALHSEVLAIKLADRSYNSLLEKKVQEREKIMVKLHHSVCHWHSLCKDDQAAGITTEESKEIVYAHEGIESIFRQIRS